MYFMNEVKEIKIENLIYEIRGKQVMLDKDLAMLYQCKNGTKSINLAVKRHLNRFPERFMFQLTKEEFETLRFQIETANYFDKMRTLPYAFTEQGVAMLATILKTPVAECVSISIMDAFVEMKKYISNNLIEQKYINNQVMKNTEDIKLLQQSFDKLSEKEFKCGLFYEGQIYDAYSLLIDILNTSKESIVLIDNYINKGILDILKFLDRKILIISNKYNKTDFDKYTNQYKNIEIKINNTFHDRFILIDKKYLYHSGASFKDLGKKCFAITKIEELDLINKILKCI